jgi:hypothetical protein
MVWNVLEDLDNPAYPCVYMAGISARAMTWKWKETYLSRLRLALTALRLTWRLDSSDWVRSSQRGITFCMPTSFGTATATRRIKHAGSRTGKAHANQAFPMKWWHCLWMQRAESSSEHIRTIRWRSKDWLPMQSWCIPVDPRNNQPVPCLRSADLQKDQKVRMTSSII